MKPSDYADTVATSLMHLIEDTRPDQLTEATPCSKWTVRDLINHVVGGGHTFAAAYRREPPATDPDMADLLGDDPQGAFRNALSAFQQAVSAPGALEGTVKLPFAELPAQMAYDVAVCDLLVHCWDLARATGQSLDPPADLVQAADGFLHQLLPNFRRGPETFEEPVTVPDDAPALERLVAYAGRQP